jgi:hypothetical protein
MRKLSPASLSILAAVASAYLFASMESSRAEGVMKMCGDKWQQAKAEGTTNGETWPQFLAQCRRDQANAPASAPSQAQVPAAPTPTTTVGTGSKTVRECEAEYAENKAAIRAAGQTKLDFVAACRAGQSAVPSGQAASPPPPAPASTQSGSLFPWLKPSSPPANAAPPPAAPQPSNYAAPATGAGQFNTEQEARYRCPSDTVVWVNERSHIYHFSGTHNYGHTKEGAYMCEADAKAAGDRAAMNEAHP